MFGLVPWRAQRSNGGVARRPQHPFEQMRNELDALFGRFFGDWPMVASAEAGEPAPWGGVDVTHEGNDMVVKAALPGFDPKDIEVNVQGERLTIRAEHKQDGNEQRGYREFEESLSVPAGVDPEKVTAGYRNGMLELRLPLPEKARGKRIPIQAGVATATAQQETNTSSTKA